MKLASNPLDSSDRPSKNEFILNSSASTNGSISLDIDSFEKPSSEPSHLKNLNMVIPKGKLVRVIGELGAGKTSLFHSLFGELRRNGDSIIKIDDSIAYSGQKLWIQNATIRENVLFGSEYDEQKYREALQFPCFRDYIGEMPEKDKGIILSGGQKARLSFARDLYAQKDIYLLDDPLSAVDVKVEKVMMKSAIMGYMEGKTRILCPLMRFTTSSSATSSMCC